MGRVGLSLDLMLGRDVRFVEELAVKRRVTGALLVVKPHRQGVSGRIRLLCCRN